MRTLCSAEQAGRQAGADCVQRRAGRWAEDAGGKDENAPQRVSDNRAQQARAHCAKIATQEKESEKRLSTDSVGSAPTHCNKQTPNGFVKS